MVVVSYGWSLTVSYQWFTVLINDSSDSPSDYPLITKVMVCLPKWWPYWSTKRWLPTDYPSSDLITQVMALLLIHQEVITRPTTDPPRSDYPSEVNTSWLPSTNSCGLRDPSEDRVKEMAKMKRTRKGGLNLVDKIFPECFVRFQKEFQVEVEPKVQISLSLSLSTNPVILWQCYFYSPRTLRPRTLNNTAI